MEPIGFSVGIIGLSGLYSTCVDLFKTIKGIRSFDREHRILATKLDIEKDLFLQWGERVGAVPANRNMIDSRLLEADTEKIVCKALLQIKSLLSDTKALERKYGMKAMEPRFRNDNDGIVSHRRMSRFDHAHRLFTQQTRTSNEQPSKLSRWRWAVHDKEKFEGLLNHLSYFVEKLTQMVPAVERRRMINEDLVPLSNDPQSLRLIEEATKDIHDDWSDAASTMASLSEAGLSSTATSETYVNSETSKDERRSGRDRRRSRSREVTSTRRRTNSRARETAAEMMNDVFGFSGRRR